MKLIIRTYGLILAACLLVTGCSAFSGGEGAQKNYGAAASGRVEDFTLSAVDGPKINLNQELASHRAVLINFWATWCPPCREEIPGLISLQNKYGGDKFTILGVDIGESSTKVEAFKAKMGINYPLLLDSDQRVAEMYKVVGIPTSYLVSSDGKIIGEYHSYSPDLVAAVEAAIA